MRNVDFETYSRIATNYPLKSIMDKMKMTNVNDFIKFMDLLVSSGAIPEDFHNIVEDGAATLKESVSWKYAKEGNNIRHRFSTHRFEMTSYDSIKWDDYGLVIEREHGHDVVLFTNEDFTCNKLDKVVATMLSNNEEQ